jgi:hypothetical protein
MYLLAKEVISRYCSTGGLQYFAQGCVEVSVCEYKELVQYTQMYADLLNVKLDMFS